MTNSIYSVSKAPMCRGALLKPKSRPCSQISQDHVIFDANPKFTVSMARTALLDRTKRMYNKLTRFNKREIRSIAVNYELQYNCAIAASCFTYMHENNYNVNNKEKNKLAYRLTRASNNINDIMGFSHF